jgi:hypothetical protein
VTQGGAYDVLGMRYGIQRPAIGSPFTPDPLKGAIIMPAAMPASVTVNATVNPPIPGEWMRLCWLQDSTGGRVVTYNAAVYKTGGVVAQTTVASTMMIDDLFYDDLSGFWRIFSRVTGQ